MEYADFAGTGKTTTARKMGKVYYDMGFLATAEVVEGSATDLVGQYVGQTGPKAQKLLEKALGKVLFIDEAYRLAEGAFAKEAMDEIVDCITKPRFAQKLIIILAGYDADINRLMSINPGLTSRFPESLQFRGLNPEECRNLLTKLFEGHKRKLLQKGGDMDITVLYPPNTEFLEKLQNRFQELTGLSSWANARDIQTIAKSIFGNLIASVTGVQNELHLDEATILAQLDSMIAERSKRGSFAALNPFIQPSSGFQASPNQFASPPAPFSTKKVSSITSQEPPQAAPSNNELHTTKTPSDDVPRDAGVSHATWSRLQQDKLAAEAKEAEYNLLLQEETTLTTTIAEAEAEATALEQHQQSMDGDAKREHEEARLKHELNRRAYEIQLETLRRRKEEGEQRRKMERKAQTKLRALGVCPVGYRWIKQVGGYGCAGGTHFVSDAQLGL